MKMLGLFSLGREVEAGSRERREASSSVLVRVRLRDVGTATTVHVVDRIARAGAGRLAGYGQLGEVGVGWNGGMRAWHVWRYLMVSGAVQHADVASVHAWRE